MDRVPHHLLTLWNPSYAADAMDEHLRRLGLRREGVVTQAAQMLYGTRFLPDSPPRRPPRSAPQRRHAPGLCSTRRARRHRRVR